MAEADLTHVKLQHELARKSSIYYEQTEAFAKIAQKAFRHHRQLRSIETLAFRAHSPVDVFAFIKSQTGKAKKNQEWRYRDFGPELLNTLDNKLRAEAQTIANQVYGDSPEVQHQMHVHLALIRLYMRYLISNYLYHLDAKDGSGNGEDKK